ncbi:hypothetical protein LTS15_008824 [Exophiala xenobiotica]|nr:hypothetical protein LTS15_008824 [Exophiala xenobiotica]
MASGNLDSVAINNLIAKVSRQKTIHEHARLIACNGNFRPGDDFIPQNAERCGSKAFATTSATTKQFEKHDHKDAPKNTVLAKSESAKQGLIGIGSWMKHE